VHIVGPMAELISEAVVAMEFKAARGHRPHLPRAPLAVESTKEAAWLTSAR
jgi:hypothetical protein